MNFLRLNARNLRDLVLAVFSIELLLKSVDFLSSFLGFSKLFFPLASIIYAHPGFIVNVGGVVEQISPIWLILMVALTISLVSKLTPETSTYEQTFIAVVLLTGIFAYRFRISMLEILIYTVVILATTTIIWIGVFNDDSQTALGKSANYTAIALIFGLTWGLIDTFLFLPEILLGLIGLSLIYKRVRGLIQSIPAYVGVEDQLYRSSILVLHSPTGIATASVIYLALFSSTVIFPYYPIPIDFDHLFSLRPLSLFANIGGGILSPVFYSLIFIYWFKLLIRAEHSVDYWVNGFRKKIHVKLDNRPSIIAIALPTIGWLVTRIPAWL